MNARDSSNDPILNNDCARALQAHAVNQSRSMLHNKAATLVGQTLCLEHPDLVHTRARSVLNSNPLVSHLSTPHSCPANLPHIATSSQFLLMPNSQISPTISPTSDNRPRRGRNLGRACLALLKTTSLLTEADVANSVSKLDHYLADLIPEDVDEFVSTLESVPQLLEFVISGTFPRSVPPLVIS